MTMTARLRLAGLLAAAAIAASLISPVRAEESGPTTAITSTTTTPPASPATPADAGPKAKKRETYPFRGVIGTIDAAERTVTLEGRQSRRVIRVTEVTRLERDGKPSALENFKAGDTVGGTLKRNASGQEEALLIRVGPKGAPAGPGTGADAPPERAAAEKGGHQG